MLQPLKQRARGQQQNTIPHGFPAPTNGLVANMPMYGAGDVGAESAIFLYNFIAGEYGCRVRNGTDDFCKGIQDANGVDGEVRTVMLYNSVIEGGTDDFMFAATDAGIYEISSGLPVLSLSWPVTGGRAGWVSYINYTNVAGAHYLLVCDEENGYYIFDGTNWALGTFTGSPKPDADKLVQITEWQGRIWFVEKDTARAWFLDPLALTGDITPMDVGSRFKKGGHLVQNTTWTIDDGAGMDDKFVMISGSGDVLVWQGVNPTTADDMTLVGRWFVGAVPAGRRVMSDWGGDVYIIATVGLIKLASLMSGAMATDPNSYITRNISRYFRLAMQRSSEEYGWQLELDAADGIIVISVPTSAAYQSSPIQFVMNVATGAWSMFRDVDMLCMDKNVNGFFYGTRDGRVRKMEGTADITDGFAKAITFSMLTHYTAMGNPAIWKRPQFVRPSWIGSSQPSVSIKVLFDFEVRENRLVPPYTEPDVSKWDEDLWDQGIWGGTAQSYFETYGVNGMGRHLALAIIGQTVSDLSYIGCDLMGDVGGML